MAEVPLIKGPNPTCSQAPHVDTVALANAMLPYTNIKKDKAPDKTDKALFTYLSI